MVMALCAIEPASEEHADLFRHGVGGRTNPVIRKEVTRRRIIPVRREPFTGALVVGHIPFNGVADPFPILLAPLRRQSVRENRYAEDVGKTKSPVIDKFGGCDE